MQRHAVRSVRRTEPAPTHDRHVIGSENGLGMDRHPRHVDDGNSVGGQTEDHYAYLRGERHREAPPPYHGHTYDSTTEHSHRPRRDNHRQHPPMYSSSATEHSYHYPDEGRRARSGGIRNLESAHTDSTREQHFREPSRQAGALVPYQRSDSRAVVHRPGRDY